MSILCTTLTEIASHVAGEHPQENEHPHSSYSIATTVRTTNIIALIPPHGVKASYPDNTENSKVQHGIIFESWDKVGPTLTVTMEGTPAPLPGYFTTI
jgi:hypothetical protein